MKTIFFTLICLLSPFSVALAVNSSIADQTWTCVVDVTGSQARLKTEIAQDPKKNQPSIDFNGLSIADLKAFEFVIQNGQIVDGYAQGLERSDLSWDFKNASPEPITPNNQTYSLIQPQISQNGEITVGLNSDGWDHFNYEIKVNPTNHTAEVHESIEIDCAGGSLGIAVYSCHQ
jgi:hypothetical protein